LRDCRYLRIRALRRTVVTMRDDVTGSWRKVHNEEIHYFNCLPDIVRIMNWRSMRWA
jgi:hypothetical protein